MTKRDREPPYPQSPVSLFTLAFFPGGHLGKFLLGMCRWSLRAPIPLQSILWPFVDPILVSFGQICHFCDPNLVTFYFYELTHFLN